MIKKTEKLYNKKLIISGNRIEIYNYNCYLKEGKKCNNTQGRKGNKVSGATKDNKYINRKTTLYRARNKIIRLISSNEDLDIFITLTYKENFQDIKKSKEHLKSLFKKLQMDHKDFKYIYVLEYQSRGAIHYHILCNIKIETSLSSKIKKSKEHKALENNFRVKYWSNRGFLDIRDLRQDGNTNIGKYISSYLVEDLLTLDLQGNKCYGYSRNLNKPIEIKIDSKDSIEEQIQELKGYEVTYSSCYDIAYTDNKGHYRSSKVNYIDLYKKGDNNNEIK